MKGLSQISIIPIQDEQQWHALRAKHIGASEVAGLFNRSPYTTAYSLYQVKSGRTPQPPVDEARTAIGRAMEPVIAGLYAEEAKLELIKANEYYECDVEPFLGATLDYYFRSYEGNLIAAEIKFVSTWAWRDHGWSPEDDYLPPHYEIQLISQLMATGWKEGRLVAFCDGEMFTFPRKRGEERVEKVVEQILAAVADMKRRISEKDEPDAFGQEVDLKIMGLVARPDKSKPVLDLTKDRQANNALHDLFIWQGNKKAAEDEINKAKAKLTQYFVRATNEETVAHKMITSHYRLSRTVSEIGEQTIIKRASTRVLFTVNLRDDPLPEAIDPTTKLMGG